MADLWELHGIAHGICWLALGYTATLAGLAGLLIGSMQHVFHI